jgi:hypothetical protein
VNTEPWLPCRQVRLLKIIASRDLSIDADELESRLQSLLCIVPDMGTSPSESGWSSVCMDLPHSAWAQTHGTARVLMLHAHAAGSAVTTMKASLLTALLQDVDHLPAKLIALRDVFPTANVSALVASKPSILLATAPDVERSAAQLKGLLQVDSIDRCAGITCAYVPATPPTTHVLQSPVQLSHPEACLQLATCSPIAIPAAIPPATCCTLTLCSPTAEVVACRPHLNSDLQTTRPFHMSQTSAGCAFSHFLPPAHADSLAYVVLIRDTHRSQRCSQRQSLASWDSGADAILLDATS